MEPARLAYALRLAAAVQEQLGHFGRAGDLWEAFFKVAQGGNASAVLGDHLNLVRVRAKDGRLDEAARRRFIAKLGQAAREDLIPRDLFLKLAGVYRGLSGRGYLVAEAFDAAFDELGRALWHVKRHNRLFQNDRADISDFHACLEDAGAESGRTLWRGRALDQLSVDAWAGRA